MSCSWVDLIETNNNNNNNNAKNFFLSGHKKYSIFDYRVNIFLVLPQKDKSCERYTR